MSNLRLSPKHGVNPTIPVCYFCGKTKNEIVLLGRLKGEDKAAPREMVFDDVPCDKCAKQMETHSLLIECREDNTQSSHVKFGKNEPHRTGRIAWLKHEALSSVLNIDATPACFITEEAFNNIINMVKEN